MALSEEQIYLIEKSIRNILSKEEQILFDEELKNAEFNEAYKKEVVLSEAVKKKGREQLKTQLDIFYRVNLW